MLLVALLRSPELEPGQHPSAGSDKPTMAICTVDSHAAATGSVALRYQCRDRCQMQGVLQRRRIQRGWGSVLARS
jgi:hypothetical protein